METMRDRMVTGIIGALGDTEFKRRPQRFIVFGRFLLI